MANTSSRICIIPARGGSKRIPGKNIRNFFQKPIIQYAIQTALDSFLFDEIMVSTDDNVIKKIALDSGAKVPFLRSEKNADDTATTVDVILEVLEMYHVIGQSFDYGCCIYPVTPLTTVKHIQTGWQLLQTRKFDTVLPIVPFSYPIWRGLKKIDEKIEWLMPENALARTQDLPLTYHDAGQWYWFKTNALKSKRELLTDNTGSIILDELSVQDVDNELDWKMLELKYKLGLI
jgi:pseudaminic acid cytidylyltransferase